MAKDGKVQKGSSILLNRFLRCLGHLLLVGPDWVGSKGNGFDTEDCSSGQQPSFLEARCTSQLSGNTGALRSHPVQSAELPNESGFPPNPSPGDLS